MPLTFQAELSVQLLRPGTGGVFPQTIINGKRYVRSEEGEAFEISVHLTNIRCYHESHEGRYLIPNDVLDRRSVYAGISVVIDGKSIGYSKCHKIGLGHNDPAVFRYMTYQRNVTHGIETRSELRFMAPQVVDAFTYGRMVPSNNKAQLSLIRVGVSLKRDTKELVAWPSVVNNDLPIQVVDGSKKFFEVPSVTVASGLKSVVDIAHKAVYKSQRLSDCMLRSPDIYIESETNLEILRRGETTTAAALSRDLKRPREEEEEDDDDIIEVPRVKREKKIDVIDLT